jgi:multidrug efflux pump subunit AcrA (membrane-fusion protein)
MNKKTAGALLFGTLTALIFCSRTIYTYNMPAVHAVQPSRGALTKRETVTGIAAWADIETIYARVAGSVETVYVKEGDTVAEGQLLVQFTFDHDEADRNLQEIRNALEKTRHDIGYTASKIAAIDQALAVSENGASGGNSIHLEISAAMRALHDAELMYPAGAVSGRDVDHARNTLQALLLNYQEQKADLQYSLAVKRLDEENLLLQEARYAKTLDDFRTFAAVTAPCGGVIESLTVTEGMFVNKDSHIVSIGAGSAFTVECTVSLNNNFVIRGDVCTLDNAAHVLDGTVTRVKPSGRGKTVSIVISSLDVSAGETFEVTFEKQSTASYILVPNSALNQDADGYFLNQIKRRKGIMGNEYYVARLDVYIGDSDYRHTAITGGVTFFEPIASVSDKPLCEGQTIVLQNAEDFFVF